MKVLEAIQIKKSYQSGSQQLEVIKGVSLSLEQNETVALMGPSGSGKSTLLQILGTMYKPDSGQLRLADQDVLNLSDDELSKFRRRHLGFVFQKFNLLANLTAQENVAWPLLIDGRNKKSSYLRAEELLQKVGLQDRLGHLPSKLSGGEQQRVAIARALVAQPKIVFADEPTGALDSATGVTILNLLKQTVLSEQGALLLVTHDPAAAQFCDRTLRLRDGLPC